MKQSFMVLGIFVAFLIACQNKPATTVETTETSEEINGHHTDDHSHAAKAVQLNNGEKWPANAETTTGIRNMSALIDNYNDAPETEDCRALKAKLASEFDKLIQQCTMTGEAHDQLHNYLTPLREKFEELETADGEQCNKVISEIKSQLDNYNNFFV